VTRGGVEEAKTILSTTGDRGYDALPADKWMADYQAMSYPAKPYHLLAARAAAGAAPPGIYPTELILDHGFVLWGRVLQIAAASGAGTALTDIDSAGAIAELYAPWAIRPQPGLRPPTTPEWRSRNRISASSGRSAPCLRRSLLRSSRLRGKSKGQTRPVPACTCRCRKPRRGKPSAR
jgi:hypothetical protein